MPAEEYALAKLRVLHIYRTYFPETQGGGQEAIRQLSLATNALGIENTIFALARKPTPQTLDLPEGRLSDRLWREQMQRFFPQHTPTQHEAHHEIAGHRI